MDADDIDDERENPYLVRKRVDCECGASYLACGTETPRASDSPGYFTPEPGEERCEECLSGSVISDTCDTCGERHCGACEACDA